MIFKNDFNRLDIMIWNLIISTKKWIKIIKIAVFQKTDNISIIPKIVLLHSIILKFPGKDFQTVKMWLLLIRSTILKKENLNFQNYCSFQNLKIQK